MKITKQLGVYCVSQFSIFLVTGTDTCPMKSVVRRIGQQLFTALSEKGIAVLVNHGIAEEKVILITLTFHTLKKLFISLNE